jgi:site-specific DNA recombinase
MSLANSWRGRAMYVIATELNQQGYRTNKGGVWTDTAVHRLISNEVYLSKTIYGKTRGSGHKHKLTEELRKNDRSDWIIVEGTHEALITEEQFDKIKVILERNRLIKSKAVRGSHKLSAIVRCHKCGSSMSFLSKYYGGRDVVSVKTCQKRDFMTGARCGGKGIKEDIVLDALYESLKSYENELAQQTGEDNSSEIERLSVLIADREKHLTKLNGALEKLLDMYEMGDVSRDMYLERKQKWKTEISEATALIEDAHRQLRYYTNQSKADKLENLRNLFEVWDNADNETINRHLKAVVSKVVLHVEEIAARRYNVSIDVDYN